MRLRKALAVLALSLLPWALTAQAPKGRNMAYEAKVEQELQARHPELLETFRDARMAQDREDPETAMRLYQQVLKVDPEFDPALRRLGGIKIQQGAHDAGLVLVKQALKIRRAPETLSALAFYVGFPGGSLSKVKEDQQQALDWLLEARTLRGTWEEDEVLPAALLALEREQLETFHQMMKPLKTFLPQAPATHYLMAISAAIQEHWFESEREIREAGRLGLPKAEVEEFLAKGISTKVRIWKAGLGLGGVILIWMLGLLLIFAGGWFLSRRTLRSLDAADPSVEIGPAERRLRETYGRLIGVAGFYYYLSLPMVVILVAAVTFGLLYLMATLGYIPVKLAALLVIGAVYTVYQMIRCLFVKVQHEDPGRILKREEAEGLWSLAESVAHEVGTRPVDEIRVLPGTEVAVYEGGTRLEKRQDRATRVLLLGAAVLPGFDTTAFRAVLAHEYGHFSNRDTAGGALANRVSRDLANFLVAIYEGGFAHVTNMAVHFLRFYHWLFNRISAGATRLQEVLADRLAARTFGAPAFESGLSHVIAARLHFEAVADQEIRSALDERRPLQNLYTLPRPEGADVETSLQQELERPTSELDSHPGPKDRFTYVRKAGKVPAPPLEGTSLLSLFRDPEGLLREMTQEIEGRLDRSLEPVPES